MRFIRKVLILIFFGLFIYYNAFIGVPLYILNLSNAQSSVHKNSGLRILVRRQLNELSLFSITYNMDI